ncbi:MAG: hypothetical protein IPJ71_03960 [Bdellovibrionales bacterium]|nr:hypothetical protein [Bdellovibrionales bacterium]
MNRNRDLIIPCLILITSLMISIHQGCTLNGAWHDQSSEDSKVPDFSDLFQPNPAIPIFSSLSGNEINADQDVIFVYGGFLKPWVDAIWDHQFGDGSKICTQETAPNLKSATFRCSNEGEFTVSLWVKYEDGGTDIFSLSYQVKKDQGEPPPPVDGVALYASYCASCHKALGQSTKRGRTSQQIRDAIANVVTMNNLVNLTTEEIDAIAKALK